MKRAIVFLARKLGLLYLFSLVTRRALIIYPHVLRDPLLRSIQLSSVTGVATHEEILSQSNSVKSLTDNVFRGLPMGDWPNTTNIDIIHTRHGVLRSTKNFDPSTKFDCNQYFQYREKAETALSVCSMWRGGDYMEFGSTDLNTFRNMLTATDIYSIMDPYPDTKFYAFDVFGKVDAESDLVKNALNSDEYYKCYMEIFRGRGDVYRDNVEILKQHNLFVDKCSLIQGYFEDTLTREFAKKYLASGKKVGFAFLDCNIAPPYKIVFEFLVDLVANDSYIYMDEYYSPSVIRYFDEFVAELRKRRNMDARLMRNAGGFGALFYLFTADEQSPALNFNK